MNGHLRVMRNSSQTAAKASQEMWVSVTKYYNLNAEITGRFIYHTNGVGGDTEMASKKSESLFSSALHSSSKFSSSSWLRNTRRTFIPVVLWHLYVKFTQEVKNGGEL